jgi:16S rRNA (uracil1498-N3)-methyltransferase
MSTTRHAALKRVLVTEAASQPEGTGLVRLEAEKLKHLRKVLRMEWDESVLVTDGSGRLFEAALEKIGDQGGVRLNAKIREEKPGQEPILFLALSKNSTMDAVVEKAVECGVSAIVPIVSSRSVVRPDSREIEKYTRRWQLIMDGAVEQSERLWRPIVEAPVSWREGLAKYSDARGFAFVSELRAEESQDGLARTLEALRSAKDQRVRLMIGPEGGFTEQERSEMKQAGFQELSLGRAVLRVETAVVGALMLLRASQKIQQVC